MNPLSDGFYWVLIDYGCGQLRWKICNIRTGHCRVMDDTLTFKASDLIKKQTPIIRIREPRHSESIPAGYNEYDHFI